MAVHQTTHRGYVGPTVAEVSLALDAARERLVALLEQVDDPAPMAVGVWTIGETAAHVASSASFFLGVLRGENDPEAMDEVAANNAAYLAEEPERHPPTLAVRFDAGERALLDHAAEVEGDPPVELFEGAVVPLSTVLGVELGEVLVHGFDIARAAGVPWPIDREVAAVCLAALMPMLPSMVDADAAAGFDARTRMRIRGGETVDLVFEDGRLHLEEPGESSVDCHLSVDPVAYLLVAFDRVSPVGQMLRGRMMAWGRRPWLAARLPTLFVSV